MDTSMSNMIIYLCTNIFKQENNSRDEGTRSSSGNWSGSSSTRTSLESDIQHQHTHPQVQKSHNSITNSTQEEEEEEEEEEEVEKESDSTLKREKGKENGNQNFDHHHHSPSSSFDQESFFSESYPETTSRTTEDLPSSSSHTSDGTLTPTQDIGDIPFVDDDTGSAFSCDAEGYYTSFHIDSGLRSISYEGNKLATDSDVEVFGRGSTGTTNSSASLGTVIMRNPEKKTPPKPPQRVSSLERKENRESVITVIHVNGSASSSREDVAGAESTEKEGRTSKESDSGRETAETMSPKNNTFSPEPCEQHSETFVDRKENFRAKTTINTSGIPSMCVITPPQSDDESVRSGSFHSPREAPQGESRVQRKVAAFQGNTNNNKVTNFAAVRQPGDGAVAPTVPSSSPSFTTHSTQQSYAPTLTVMSQHRGGEISAQLKVFPPSQEQPQVPKSQTDYFSLGRSVSERRAEIQLKVLGERKPSSDVLLQKQTSKESQMVSSSDLSNLVSYKELPTTITSSHPFSAIPSNVKQDVVITPTNSLERRKANSKLGGAHVTLDSEGKVVYSSDSLPRRKGHTSFEPGPYIKPPPITSTPSNGTQSKIRLSGVSSIQSMPLPPVPGQQTTQSYSISTPASTVTAARTTTRSLENTPTSSTVTPQQPKLGTRTQASVLSQTLSGLSSHMQPRTISQINSIRSAQVKSPKTVLQEPVKSTREDSSKFEESKFENLVSQNQQSYQAKLQSQIKEKIEQMPESAVTTIPSILKKTSSVGKDEIGKYEESQLFFMDHKEVSKIFHLGTEGRATPIPRPISTSPPPYDHYNVTNSDIYGRIGMTRQVQVGGTLPAGFGRNQRTYSSLPPNLRQPLPTAAEIIVQQGRLRQHSGSKTLTRRASVAGTETSNITKAATSNPSTPEKALDKKEKGSKREKDKDKDKDKKKKETKTEKSPKKKWFWTLPLRRKKKSKDDQSTEDDDGGFKEVSVKAVRKIVPAEDTSFIRYPSPDTGSSDLNSSYSSDLSSGEHGYRSSPSSEVYYYSQRAQLAQQQQQQQQAMSMSIP
ncbi:hypothetical protein Anas_00817, partial [Armadillidium nasatum]